MNDYYQIFESQLQTSQPLSNKSIRERISKMSEQVEAINISEEKIKERKNYLQKHLGERQVFYIERDEKLNVMLEAIFEGEFSKLDNLVHVGYINSRTNIPEFRRMDQ